MARFTLLLLAVLLIAGCTRNSFDGSGGVRGEQGSPESSLAYEHTVSIALSASQIGARMAAVRDSCVEATFAECSLLRFEETAGDFPSGLLTVRLAPDGVEPIVALAATDGAISSHVTRAEDLSKPSADMAREREQLEAQRTIIRDFQSRKDLSAADMIAIAQELSSIESRLADVERDQATLERRVETNLLTIRYTSRTEEGSWARIRSAVGESVNSFVNGTVEAIGMAAFGIPFILVAFPLALLWRWMWRRATSRHRTDAT